MRSDLTPAVDQKAEEFLRSCVRFAKTWQLSDDPMAGLVVLIDARLFIEEGQKQLEQQVRHSPRNYWRQSMNPADQAAAIWDSLTCHNSRCPCHQHKLTHCPAHQDSDPSFSVTAENGRLLVHCFTGCSQQAVIDALTERELWTAPRGGVG